MARTAARVVHRPGVAHSFSRGRVGGGLDNTGMKTRMDRLERLATELAEILPCADVSDLDDDETLGCATAAEAIGRRLDALRVVLAGEIEDRSRSSRGINGLAAGKGCRTSAELLERITRVSAATARRRIRLAADVARRPFPGGTSTPARFDRVRAAFTTGALGEDTALAITRELTPLLAHSSLTALAAAETELVAAATGTSPDNAPPTSADEVRIMAALWRARIDPDGLDPAENRAMKRRDLRWGREHDGLVTMRCEFLAEAAARAKILFDSFLSPTTAVAFLSDEERAAHNVEKDPRTPGQQRHDILVGVLDTMARSRNTPQIGGAAPTVLVSVRAEELASGHGAGHGDRTDTPLSMTTVKQMICTGGTPTVVLNAEGRILSLGSPERCFTASQRRAITLRDGGCLIPGCQIPAGWCEIHHVIPDAQGGPTHTDNGVLLCWFHHRTIDTSGWRIRMIRGTPQIKAPPWLDWAGSWRPATKSRTTLTRRLRPPPG